MRIATERGRADSPNLKIGVCGEHGGDPESITLFEQVGLDYVSCSPFRVPIARLAAAQAVLASGRAVPAKRASPRKRAVTCEESGPARTAGAAKKAAAPRKAGRAQGPQSTARQAPLAGPERRRLDRQRLALPSCLVAIPDEDVARVRAATDIVALIGEHAGLKRQGRRFVGLCPFHEEKTPSFSVNAEEGIYYCFGCQASGDAITFVRATEHLDFVEAVRRLADRAGIAITEDEAVSAENRRRAPLYKVMSDAVDWYHERLLQLADAGSARDYLRSRGYGSGTSCVSSVSVGRPTSGTRSRGAFRSAQSCSPIRVSGS